ncbi:xanthine phosphoribosyltransferase [Thermohalobacter berrensis]|uniref:Xanthine phosphoribosyltransferase n=1 Tax=Thermohalobacter berrensis TaxID=99594 RepID=A0A419SV94_9FIRM|nr:xanthine phosphoribosyltransferase [Thermohalobacter berrensis]RKD29139.1 xanthine phosphoribosyltransferase [Thermohalobacter berrensis]
MDLLKEKILREGRIEEGNILKVDSFLNHKLDIDLLNEIGKEFRRRFDNSNITKILTIETSGIAIAAITAQYFDVPVVFARKIESKNLDKETYQSEVYSYTKGKKYKIKISKRYITNEDNILIIDDFLARGKAVLGLIDIIEQARANIVGAGIVIEKGFQEGGKILRKRGINVNSLAIIESMGNNKIIFK